MARTTTGRSDRTPAKHELMTRLFGREVGCAQRHSGIDRLLWLDLTAGDGVALDGRPWHISCSPGILAHHASWAGNAIPTRVVLHERAASTYRTLLGNLAEQLGQRGYVQTAEDEWRFGPYVHLSVVLGSGEEADLSGIDGRTAVMVSNDPNSIADWALTPAMIAEIRRRTSWCLGISTMGCNVAGLKRLPFEERMPWYEHVGSHVQGLHRWHDLYLCAIERDASQWAYLIESPSSGTWPAQTQEAARKAFARQGMSLRSSWWRNDPNGFRRICDELFLTRNQLDGAAS